MVILLLSTTGFTFIYVWTIQIYQYENVDISLVSKYKYMDSTCIYQGAHQDVFFSPNIFFNGMEIANIDAATQSTP